MSTRHEKESSSLLSDGEEGAAISRRRWPHTTSRGKRFLAALFNCIRVLWSLVVLAAALVILSERLIDKTYDLPPPPASFLRERYRVAEDFTDNVPHFATHLHQFDESPGYTYDPRYATTTEMEAVISRWGALTPMGDGFVLANNSRELLAEPKHIASADEGLHNIAVYHQIHCLYRLMMTYNDAVLGVPTDVDHARHCFNHLRQSLMCFADTTLEGVNPDSDKPGSMRIGAHRVCKDYRQVFAWSEAHRRTRTVPSHQHSGERQE